MCNDFTASKKILEVAESVDETRKQEEIIIFIENKHFSFEIYSFASISLKCFFSIFSLASSRVYRFAVDSFHFIHSTMISLDCGGCYCYSLNHVCCIVDIKRKFPHDVNLNNN